MRTGDKLLHFASFRLDLDSERLWQGGELVSLRPKAWAVLRYLAERPGRLVSKEELLLNVWKNVAVTGATLPVTIRELRAALGDDARNFRFIETVRSRGYRFIAPLESPIGDERGDTGAAASHATASAPDWLMVGREAEESRLADLLRLARVGQRQVVLVTGEAGIGKTWLVDAFVRSLQEGGTSSILFGRGQCIESHGETEPYMPIFEALTELRRGPQGDRITAVLRERTPVVLAQMPGWLPHEEAERLLQSMLGSRSGRMLRLMADAVEAAAVVKPLLIVVEDLHWSDPSTLDLIAMIAQRRSAARLMLIATCRPGETGVREEAVDRLRAQLVGRQHCCEMALEPLGEDAVTEYVEHRLAVLRPARGKREATLEPQELARALHRRTEGNPLFVKCLLDYVLNRDQPAGAAAAASERIAAIEAAVPIGVSFLVEHQLASLMPEECRVLEAASIVGMEFSASTVAAVLAGDAAHIGAVCQRLARSRNFVHEVGDPTRHRPELHPRYAFLHVMVRQVLYQQTPSGERTRMHRAVGSYLERAMSDDLDEVAAEIAAHFRRGGDDRKATEYYERAARHARRRCAYTEEIVSLRRALESLGESSAGADEAQALWRLDLALGEAHWRAGETSLAHDWFQAALANARRCRSPLSLARTALAYGRSLRLPDVDRDDALVNLTREALEAVGESDDPIRAQLLSKLAFALYFRPPGWQSPADRQRRRELSDEACALAKRLGDPEVIVAVLYDRRWSEWQPDNSVERRALTSELGLIAHRERNLEMLAEANFFRFCDSLEAGDRNAADAALGSLTRLAEELRHPWYTYLAKVHRSTRSSLQGQFAEAKRQIEEACAIGNQIDEPLASQILGAQLLTQAGTQGTFEQMQELALSSADRFPQYPTYGAVTAWVRAEVGQREAAQRQIDRMARNDFADLRRDNTWLTTTALLSIAVALCGDEARAAILVDLLSPHANQGVVLHGGFAYLGCVARHLGMLYATLRRWKDCEECFETALGFDESLGALPWLSRTRLDYAEALLGRTRSSDRLRARQLLLRAADEAAPLGMTKLVSRINGALSRLAS